VVTLSLCLCSEIFQSGRLFEQLPTATAVEAIEALLQRVALSRSVLSAFGQKAPTFVRSNPAI